MALNEMDAQVHRLLVRERNREPLSAQKREELKRRLQRAVAEQRPAGLGWWRRTRMGVRFAIAFSVLTAMGGAAVALMLNAQKPAPITAPLHKVLTKQAEATAVVLPAAEDASASALRAEVALIAGARRALEAGHIKEAMRLLAAHGQRFPAGTLIEEREGLGIIALWRQGQHNAAREGATRFRRQYPRSPMNRPIHELLDGSASQGR
ncbi:MAG: hypothetical protein SF187_29955 [Deltaproteobacteria bacterium]|nr:hypothetical protein [Deltaproteobacteria bacterium]